MDRTEVAQNMLRLKTQLETEIPDKDLEQHLLLATWNIRDFNIVSPEHQTMHSLLDHGFEIPAQLQRRSNIGQDHFYDQIAFITDPSTLEYIDQIDEANPKNNNAGLFDIFGSVFRSQDGPRYLSEMKASSNGKKCETQTELMDYYKTWRTYQMSDHHLMWTRIKINNSQRYLSNL